MVRITALLPALLFSAGGHSLTSRQHQAKSEKISQSEQRAVVEAIEDEIYDDSCQGYFDFVGNESGPGLRQLRVYINPIVNEGKGQVIYKFMPFGEIYRIFDIGRSGLAHLQDTITQGFGPERGGAYKTVYMDDDELQKLKQDWIHTKFTVELHPSQERVREARERQHGRLGALDYGAYKDCGSSTR